MTQMGLRRFFALLHGGSTEQAWEQLTQLELLPRSQEDMSAKLSKYKALDPVLKTSFPAILKGAMACLHSHHRKAKSGAHEMNFVAHGQLQNLQETARLLVTFGGQANLSREMHDSVARLEAEMI
jgi:Nup93/Nic96